MAGEPMIKRAPSAKKKPKVPSKMCTRCGSIKPIDQFYSNRAWAAQSHRDAWCKDCVGMIAKTKEGMREYCWYNNRLFMEKAFDDCQQQAIYQLATDREYLNCKSDNKKQTLLEAQMCKCYFSRMNMAMYYIFQDNMKEEGPIDVYNGESTAGMLAANNDGRDEDMETQVYSKDWNGTFAKREIEYLDAYYKDLQNDFVFSTVNMRDYAKKVCKASLDADNAYNRYRSGSGSLDEYKKAVELFDKLSKSVEFTECERKAGDVGGSGSFGEWVAKIEATGEIDVDEQIDWEPDHVDAVINDFRHILVACGLEGGL